MPARSRPLAKSSRRSRVAPSLSLLSSNVEDTPRTAGWTLLCRGWAGPIVLRFQGRPRVRWPSMSTPHVSDSTEQRTAESFAIEAVATVAMGTTRGNFASRAQRTCGTERHVTLRSSCGRPAVLVPSRRASRGVRRRPARGSTFRRGRGAQETRASVVGGPPND